MPVRSEIACIIDPDSGYYVRFVDIEHIHKEVSVIGAPHEIIFFDDIEKVDFTKYKMVIFPHSCEITPKKKAILDKYVFKDNKTIVTIGGFGIINGKDIDETRTEKFVGFPYQKSKEIKSKQMGNWKSVYNSNMRMFNKEILKNLAKEAGVHMYVDEMWPVYANEKLVSIHTANGGKKIVSLPRKVKQVKELYSDKIVAENTDKFEYDFKTPDTALFELID